MAGEAEVYVDGGIVYMTVPLSNGVFGAINIKTAGGVSADYTVNLGSIAAVALSWNLHASADDTPLFY